MKPPGVALEDMLNAVFEPFGTRVLTTDAGSDIYEHDSVELGQIQLQRNSYGYTATVELSRVRSGAASGRLAGLGKTQLAAVANLAYALANRLDADHK